jgi:phosphatidylethanolamine/phosphatidyl-N-methylethanolamine N-methyltransferase
VTSPSRPSQRSVRESLGFFGAFLGKPGSVGAVLPSSRYLARALVGRLDLRPGELIVEFGPGTGPMTAVIRELLPQGACYLGIELEPKFHDVLHKRFPSMDFHLGSAAELPAVLARKGLPQPSRIVSGLPFASLDPGVQDAVMDAVVDSLADEGDFRTFQYAHAFGLRAAKRFREEMRSRFSGYERVGPVMRNIPPAFILRYWSPRRGR